MIGFFSVKAIRPFIYDAGAGFEPECKTLSLRTQQCDKNSKFLG